MSLKLYNKSVVEGKGFLFFSIVLSVFLKSVHFFNAKEIVFSTKEVGCLWTPLAPFFDNGIYSAIASTVSIALIAFLVSSINLEHALIRRRTFLPSAIVILLFSCIPQQLEMSASYVGVVAVLLVISALFGAYGSESEAIDAFKVSFYLSLGSLFCPILLIYFPVVWICLIRARCFSFRSFLASLLSVFLLYAPVFSYYLLIKESPSEFTRPYQELLSVDWAALPILQYTLHNYIILGIAVLLVVLVLTDNLINSFKDKIRVRALLSILTIISIFSLLCTLLLDFDSYLPLYAVLALGALQIGHYFSLAQSKLIPYLFVILLLSFIVISFIATSF